MISRSLSMYSEWKHSSFWKRGYGGGYGYGHWSLNPGLNIADEWNTETVNESIITCTLNGENKYLMTCLVCNSFWGFSNYIS